MTHNPELQPQNCLFDMDNTLYNFLDAKINSCNSVTELIGAGNGMELLRYFLNKGHGYEHHDNIREYMTDHNVWDEQMFNKACNLYETVKLESIELYPGVKETLEFLEENGIRMAIVTDAESSQAEKRLEKTGVINHFDYVITPDISGRRKPEPDTFLVAMERLGAHPEDTWLVGDSLRREIEPGNRLGMTTVYARYGDWLKTPFASIRPDYVVDKMSELPDLMGLNNGRSD